MKVLNITIIALSIVFTASNVSMAANLRVPTNGGKEGFRERFNRLTLKFTKTGKIHGNSSQQSPIRDYFLENGPFKETKTYTEAAEIIGVTRAGMSDFVSKNTGIDTLINVKKGRTGRIPDDEKILKLLDEYGRENLKGLSAIVQARKLGTTTAKFRSFLRRYPKEKKLCGTTLYRRESSAPKRLKDKNLVRNNL